MKNQPLIVVVAGTVMLCTVATSAALCADARSKTSTQRGPQPPNPAATNNIFSPPADADVETPGYVKTRGKAEQVKEAFGGDIPTFQQIRELPSLNPSQRKSIRELYNGSKQEIQPLGQRSKAILQELKSRGQSPGARPAGAPADGDSGPVASGNNSDPAGGLKQMSAGELRDELLDLRTKIRTKRQTMWEEVKNILTNDQLRQFDQMRKGQLMPAALSDSP